MDTRVISNNAIADDFAASNNIFTLAHGFGNFLFSIGPNDANGRHTLCHLDIPMRGCSLFLDDEPTYAAFPAVHYYQGRVRQGLKLQGAVEAFRQYLRIRGASTDDPRVGELRRLVPGGAGKQAP